MVYEIINVILNDLVSYYLVFGLMNFVIMLGICLLGYRYIALNHILLSIHNKSCNGYRCVYINFTNTCCIFSDIIEKKLKN